MSFAAVEPATAKRTADTDVRIALSGSKRMIVRIGLGVMDHLGWAIGDRVLMEYGSGRDSGRIRFTPSNAGPRTISVYTLGWRAKERSAAHFTPKYPLGMFTRNHNSTAVGYDVRNGGLILYLPKGFGGMK